MFFSLNSKDTYKNTLGPLVVCMMLVLYWYISGIWITDYSFNDYHEIINSERLLGKTDLWTVIRTWIVNYELGIVNRLRISYRVLVSVQTWLFGDNFVLWNTFRLINLNLVFLFSYYVIKKITSSITWAMLLSIVVLFSLNVKSYFRFGPCETYGLLVYVVLLYLIYCYKTSYNNRTLLRLAIGLLLVFFGLLKEPFILAIPSLAIYSLLIQPNKIKRLLSSLGFVELACGVVFISLLGVLYKMRAVGLDYAGIDAKLGLQVYIDFAASVFQGNIFIQLVIIFLMTILLVRRHNFICIVLIALLYFSIVAPQLIVYAKSGMEDRYYFPLAMAFPVAVSFLVREFEVLKDKKWRRLFLIAGIIAAVSTVFSFNPLKEYKNNRSLVHMTNGLVDEIRNLEEGKKVLLVGEPGINYEWLSFGFYSLLKEEVGIFNFDIFPIELDLSEHPMFNSLKENFFELRNRKVIRDKHKITQYDYIIVVPSDPWKLGYELNNNLDDFVNIIKDIDFRDYRYNKYGRFDVFLKSDNDYGAKPSFDKFQYVCKPTNKETSNYKYIGDRLIFQFKKSDADSLYLHIIIKFPVRSVSFEFNDVMYTTEKNILSRKITSFSLEIPKSAVSEDNDNLIYPLVYTSDSSYMFISDEYYMRQISVE